MNTKGSKKIARKTADMIKPATNSEQLRAVATASGKAVISTVELVNLISPKES